MILIRTRRLSARMCKYLDKNEIPATKTRLAANTPVTKSFRLRFIAPPVHEVDPKPEPTLATPFLEPYPA
jgi:hypothetical protein